MKAESVREKYAPEAYAFVRESVNYAIAHAGEVRHVSALELWKTAKIMPKSSMDFSCRMFLRVGISAVPTTLEKSFMNS